MAKKKLEFKTEWFSVESESVNRVRSSNKKPFYRIVIPNGVMILALREDGKILLIRQYRQPINSYTLELPAGQIDKNESPRKAAIRELYEETGYVCKKFNFLGAGAPWIDRAKCKLYLFYGQGAVRKKGLKPEENIQVVPVSAEKFKQLAINGDLQQLQSFATIFLAKWKFGLEI
ncbi:MAG: NUDIX hydrolase [bacterium]|nr:NUDIX hydrolase [bacterium]